MTRNSIGKTNDRVLIGDLDSTHQADLVGEWRNDLLDPSSSEWQTRLDFALGRLRLETLLSERVVLTDAQAFDGALVTRLAAGGRLEKTRHAPDQAAPVELRIRHPHPERALWLMYHEEDGAPRGFLSSLVQDEQGRPVTGTAYSPSTSSDAVKACSETLMRSGASSDEVDEAVGGWRALLDACASGVLLTATWETEPPFSERMASSESLWPRERLRADHCLTPSARELLDNVLEVEQNRSSVYRLLDQASDLADDDMDRAAMWTRLWYDERYRRALAFQHKADYRGSDSGLYGDIAYRSALARLNDTGPELRQIKVELPAGFVEFLGNVEPHSWQHMVGLHTRNLHLWWEGGDTDAIQYVLDYFINVADSVQGRPAHVQSSLKSFGTSLLRDIVTLPLTLSPLGVVTVLGIQVFQSAAEAAASDSPTRARVEVTDYLDDVRL